MKHKTDPVTGEPATSRDIVTLHMDKDDEGRWQCPVLTKPFYDHTKIVAILQPGGNEANVYSYEAYRELNLKAKNFEDLISGQKFSSKTDVIILNDPSDEAFNQRKDINRFYHIKHSRELEKDKGNTGTVRHSLTATRVMEQLNKNKAISETAAQKKRVAPATSSGDIKRPRILAKDVTGVQYTTDKGAASFTSTAFEVSQINQDRDATEEEIREAQFRVMRKMKKKGYVRLRTTLGDLTLELHCEMVPRTCANFLGLCEQKMYDGTEFHRLIPNFMIQGGKCKDGPDESVWGGTLADEFDERLKHSGGGVVSMANAGPNTGTRQFFITYKSCNHLDRKHSVFATVIDGMEVLKLTEKIGRDKKERPLEKIMIFGTDVLANPCKEATEKEEERIRLLVEARTPNHENSLFEKPKDTRGQPSQEVGRYLRDKVKSSKPATVENAGTTIPSRLPPPPKSTSFGNFSGW